MGHSISCGATSDCTSIPSDCTVWWLAIQELVRTASMEPLTISKKVVQMVVSRLNRFRAIDFQGRSDYADLAASR